MTSPHGMSAEASRGDGGTSRMRKPELCEAMSVFALLVLMGAPGLAAAQYYKYAVSATIDSTTPDSTDPPDVTWGTYAGPQATFTMGSLTLSEFAINNMVIVLNDRAAGQEGVPAVHDMFGWKGADTQNIVGPSWLTMDNGTPGQT